MATKGNAIQFASGTYAKYAALAVKNADTLYFTSDTHQLFMGEVEYTKSVHTLSAVPTTTTVGEVGAIYTYNGNVYACTGAAEGVYTWERIANVNDYTGTVTSVTVGEGLTNATGDANPITTSGTVQHAIATGAAAHADDVVAQAGTFGGEFNIQSVSTDKFGHVVGIYTHPVSLPVETTVSVTNSTADQVTLGYGDTFTVVSEVAKGDGSHEVVRTVKSFKLPESDQHDTTYTVTSTKEGKITVTPSEGDAYDVEVNGWTDLAKKSDITAVFKFKGTVQSTSDLPTEGMAVGDVYFVLDDSSEYVYANGTWEKLGPVIDLSPYAQTKDVIARVKDATGQVPSFTEDGQLASTGFTLGCSVPADAKFTDTVYTAPTYGANATGFYKFETDAAGYVKSVTNVTADDITALGIASEDYVDDAITAATLVWKEIE